MNDKILGLILAVIGLSSLASLGAILLFIPPQTDVILVPVMFSLSLFLVLASVFTVFGVRLRKRYIGRGNRQRIFKIAFREGVLLSILLVAYLWLAHFEEIKIWTIIVPLVLIMGVEYYCLTRGARTTG